MAERRRSDAVCGPAPKSRKQNPKAMGHGTHGFSRIKQSKQPLKSEQSYPSSLNKNLAKKTRSCNLCSTEQKNRLRRWRALDLNLCVCPFFLRPLSLWRFVLDFSGEIAFLCSEVTLILRTSTERQKGNQPRTLVSCAFGRKRSGFSLRGLAPKISKITAKQLCA